MVKILVKKFDKNIKLPTYKTSGSSGMDLVAYIKNKITINPGKTAMIPTGIAVAIPKNYEIQINGRTASVVNGSITNFGLQDAHEIEVEITWWILNDCGCDAIPMRTALVEIDHVSSSSVYFFEETFPFTFEKFEFLVIGINWK